MVDAPMLDLIIIGGGPAGLSAALQALHKRLEVRLVTRHLGGKTNRRLQLPGPPPPLMITGEDLVDRFLAEITYLDFLHLAAEVDQVSPLAQGYRVRVRPGPGDGRADQPLPPEGYQARAVIVATGTQPQRLNLPGEQQFYMRGLCYSAMTYAPWFMDRTAMVIGDGPLALLSALELALIAQRVILVATTATALASPLGQRLQALQNVVVKAGYQPQAVEGDDFARRLIVTGPTGREVLEADGIFVERGLRPYSDCVAGLVERSPDGYILVDAHNRTSSPGIFAAGDVTQVHREQVLIAIGEGAKAALAAHEYLLTQEPPVSPSAQIH
ncbi:MAG TPA: NAD(P)/FAD-dependent oxidoreductase [Leptolyngbyaceae cyanobacterium M65_K2018_010]|nr:NAD(P)/FAD-dependent oxidoreductase [Leptolyngbyaceae cyanobacterium M65_K2018_010]